MPRSLAPAEAWQRSQSGTALIVDLRPAARFGQGHPAGALSVPFSERGLAERIAVAAPGASPVVLVTADDGQGRRGAAQLAAGRRCLGVVGDDPAPWLAAGAEWQTIPEVQVAALGPGASQEDPVVLDVREPVEWETGTVPGAWLLPLGRLRAELDQVPRDREIAVICEAGIRSATAASILRAAGFPRVANVPEGTAGYRALGRPLAFPEEEESI